MIEIKEKVKCCGCGACANICPQNCIELICDNEGFLYPNVDKEKCINCNLCEKVCSFNSEIDNTEVKISYAYRSKNIEQLMQSSSGGVFSDISNYILEKQGIVYGTALVDKCTKAQVIGVDNKAELEKLRGSKYFQSNINEAYLNVKKHLDSGICVLFSGTPCQVNGLKMFLNKEYENLICVDIICHGAPSQLLWEKYLKYLSNKFSIVIENVNFRSKKNGWQNYGMEIFESSGDSKFYQRLSNPFMRMFLYDYSLRPSCYECKAKKKNLSDITIGDFWGIDNICPELNNDKGTSIIIVRTNKGKDYLNKILDQGEYKMIDYHEAIQYNPADIISLPKPKKRKNFYKDLSKYSFEKMIKKYATDSLYDKVKIYMRKILKNLNK